MADPHFSSSTQSTNGASQKQSKQTQRRLQKRWLQLIDSWTQETASAPDEETLSTLTEQISQTAQELCRSPIDKCWLISAFQLGITAVLLDSPASDGTVPPSLLVQLGQQLVQLAIHSAAQPELSHLVPDLAAAQASLISWAVSNPDAATVLRDLRELEFLAERLSDYQIFQQNSRASPEDPELLSAFVHQSAPSLLLSLSQLPKSAQLVSALLQHDAQLASQAFPFRLTIVAHLLRAGKVSATELDQAGLLVGWGRTGEVSSWASAKALGQGENQLAELASVEALPPGLLDRATEPVNVDDPLSRQGSDALLAFYLDQAQSLRNDYNLPDHALDLCQRVSTLVEISEPSKASEELKQLHLNLQLVSQLNAAQSSKSSQPFDQETLDRMQPQQVASMLIRSSWDGTAKDSPTDVSKAAQEALRRLQLFEQASKSQPQRTESSSPFSIKESVFSLIDGPEAPQTSSRLLPVHLAKQLVLDPASFSLSKDEAAAILAGALYARGSSQVGRVSFANTRTQISGLQQAVEEVQHVLGSCDSAQDTALLPALRSLLAEDASASVSPKQVFVQLIGSKTPASVTIAALRTHLAWIDQLQRQASPGAQPGLNEATEANALDMCWMLAAGGKPGSKQAQKSALESITDLFTKALSSQPSSRDRGLDVSEMRKRAAWSSFVSNVPSLVAPGGPFAALDKQEAIRIILAGLLRAGDVELFRAFAMDSEVVEGISDSQLEQLVLSVSTELYDLASVASTSRPGEMKTANEILNAVPASTSIKLQRNFIEATCRLCSFRIRSPHDSSKAIEAREVRATLDRMDLVSRLVASKEDAYKSPELILDIANKLCAIGPGQTEEVVGLSASQRTMVEVRTLAMLADAATAASDFDEASGFCTRLVEKIGTLRKRAEAQERSRPGGGSGSGAGSMLPAALELGWKTCFQLSKHPGWEDTPSRLTVLGHVLSLCPPERLGALLKTWTQLDAQLTRELGAGKVFASTAKKDTWTPLSFSPLAYLSPAQQLFDAPAGYLANLTGSEAAATRAARAAKSFLGGWTGSTDSRQTSSTATSGTTASRSGGGGGGGFSLSSWLIGDDRR